MKGKKFLVAVLFLTVLSLSVLGCKTGQYSGSQQSNAGTSGPRAVLDTFFSSAVQKNYKVTYSCYYKEYKKKISESEFVKHRKEASVLQKYTISSVIEDGNKAHAEVLLTWAPSKTFKRDKPVTKKIKEDLIKENGQWKIKVW
ncbi:MAG: nuclear transport factor 2 family protein [Candidatus Aquicultor sp.]